MADSNREEIAKLEALYANNPEGRVFTHLAEAYRKAGELDRARVILQEGLARHPAYASAHVVLGRVLTDQQNTEEAAEEFRRVLDLDPHNHVALRCLGDIARSAGRRDEALHYFTELRQIDPNNDELVRVIEELKAEPQAVMAPEPETAEPGAAEAEPEPAARPEEVVAPQAEASAPEPEEVDSEPEPEPEPEVQAEEPAPFTPMIAEAEPLAEPETAGDLGEDLEFDWVPSLEEEEAPGLPGDLGELAALGVDELTTELPAYEEPPQPEEFGNIDLSVTEEAEAADTTSPPVPEFSEQAQSFAEEIAAAPVAEPEQGEEATGEVLTETIAELYRAQGLYDRAGDVYRALSAQRPDDETLKQKLAEVEALARGGAAAAREVAPEPVFLADADDEDAEPWETAAVSSLDVEEGAPAAPPFEATGPESLQPAEAEAASTAEVRGSQGPGEEAEAWIAGSASEPASAPSPYAWAEAQRSEPDGGPPISDYFRRLLSWKPSSAAARVGAPESGDSFEPTTDEPFGGNEPDEEPVLLLDEQVVEEEEVFVEPVADAETRDPWLDAAVTGQREEWQAPGSEAPAEPTPSAAPAPVPQPPTPAPPSPNAANAPAEPLDAAAAFDEWFNEAAPAQPTTTPQPPVTSAEDESSEDDDLEMFRSWLQSLKK